MQLHSSAADTKAEALHDLSLLFNPTWTPKVCKIMAFMAVILGLGLLFYILLGFR